MLQPAQQPTPPLNTVHNAKVWEHQKLRWAIVCFSVHAIVGHCHGLRDDFSCWKHLLFVLVNNKTIDDRPGGYDTHRDTTWRLTRSQRSSDRGPCMRIVHSYTLRVRYTIINHQLQQLQVKTRKRIIRVDCRPSTNFLASFWLLVNILLAISIWNSSRHQSALMLIMNDSNWSGDELGCGWYTPPPRRSAGSPGPLLSIPTVVDENKIGDITRAWTRLSTARDPSRDVDWVPAC